MTDLQKAQLAVSEARAALLALPDDAGAEAIEPCEKRMKDAGGPAPAGHPACRRRREAGRRRAPPAGRKG